MSSEQPLNAATIVDRLCGIFAPIYAHWQESVPDQTNLWADTQGMSDIAIIERDIISIGRFFADADSIGARSEYSLLAECLAHLRIRDSHLPAQAILENEIDKACEELQQQFGSVTIAHDTFIAPMAWRLAILLQSHTGNYPTPSVIDALREAYADLANLFVLRDGNLTSEEDEQLKVYHAAFNG